MAVDEEGAMQSGCWSGDGHEDRSEEWRIAGGGTGTRRGEN